MQTDTYTPAHTHTYMYTYSLNEKYLLLLTIVGRGFAFLCWVNFIISLLVFSMGTVPKY